MRINPFVLMFFVMSLSPKVGLCADPEETPATEIKDSAGEEKIEVRPRETGQSMYHLYKGFFYPAKTFLCLLAELVFYRRLRAEVDSAGPGIRPGTGSAAAEADRKGEVG